MPRHNEKCYYCDAEYEITYHYVDTKMIHDEDSFDDESDEMGDYENEPKFCPFCGAEL